MTPERWERVQTVFAEAVALSEDEQIPFLARACEGDAQMFEETRRMVEENRRGDSILYRGLADLASRMIESPVTKLEGQQIGAYRLLRLIGEGGMGVVYLAERRDTGKQVAMKFLLGAGISPARRELFTQEIKTHAKVAHPYIAAQYDAGTLPDGTPWFVMEYVGGRHFLEYFETCGSSLATRLRLFRQVCQALEYLHGQGIVHSDLKPSNILVDESGAPRVLDFGIAKRLQTGAEDAQAKPGLRMMTLAYAAPEWIERGVFDHSTDVYALGMIFRAMLPATTSKTEKRELHKIGGKALRADPAERYRSVEALGRDVDHFLKHEPLEGVAGSRWYRMERFVARHKTGVLATVAALIVFATMATFFTMRLTEERNAALAEVKQTKLIERFLFNLFQGGDQAAGPAADVRALTLVQRGEQEAKALGREPVLQAEFYGVLGRIYEQLGQFDKANELMLAALRKRYAMGAGAGDVAASLLALGELRLQEGRLGDAERIARKALVVRTTQHPRDLAGLARAQATLGKVLAEQGHYDESLGYLIKARAEQLGREDTRADLAATVVALSDVYFYLSRYQLAEQAAQEALALHKKLNGENHPLVAMDLRNLGNLKFNRSSFAEAETYDRQALAIEEAWYGADHPETADARIYVGQAMARQGRAAEAEPLIRRSLATFERAYSLDHPRLALVLNELASVYLMEGKFGDAEEMYKRVVDIDIRAIGAEHQNTTVARNNLATAYLKMGRYVEAEGIFRRVLQTLRKQNLGHTLNAGITQVKLGRALERQGRYQEAEIELLDGCKMVTEQAGPNHEAVKAVQPDLAKIRAVLGTQ